MDLNENEALEIAVEAYVYAYPLILMDITRRVMTNVERPDASVPAAPINQFVHKGTLPDAKFTEVVRPNADTLYSVVWFDVLQEPLVIAVPDAGGRYYLLEMLDMWTDVFASPGTRTTGIRAQKFALLGPEWTGKLPGDVEPLRSPTGTGWIIGRVQVNGKNDVPNAHRFQVGFTATPLRFLAESNPPPKGTVDPSVSKAAPVEQVAKMDAATYFARFTELTKENPPHQNDYPILARLKRLGVEPGKSFDLAKAPSPVRLAFENAVAFAQRKIVAHLNFSARLVNNWRMITPPVGTYGTDYLSRACIAYFGLGANVSEDAIYPTAIVDADGKAFDSGQKYLLHFSKEEIPPARAFWSLTMYDDRQLFADNPIDRFAIGDRNELKFHADGSLDLFLQRETPGADKESNWLPTPKSGRFSLNLRLYWPKAEALDGTWRPPAVVRVS
jgi:hypothetical protein